jgi:sugar O-acyltransferase (sialic acid O-acetyltransferase NeuD family)
MINRFTIFGANNSALSMLFEILESLPGQNKEVEIILNQHQNDYSPFHVSSVKIKEIDIDIWVPGEDDQYLLGVYKPESKQIIVNLYSSKFGIEESKYSSVIHPFSSIATTSDIRPGVIINPGAILAPYCILGKFVSVNRMVTIGHHTQIGDYSTINPASNIAGHCLIGENVMIGMSSTVIDHIKIGSNSIIGAGSLVTKDVPENVLVYGSPAKIIREL